MYTHMHTHAHTACLTANFLNLKYKLGSTSRQKRVQRTKVRTNDLNSNLSCYWVTELLSAVFLFLHMDTLLSPWQNTNKPYCFIKSSIT